MNRERMNIHLPVTKRGILWKVIQVMLGQVIYATTMDIYSYVDSGVHREAGLEMDRALSA